MGYRDFPEGQLGPQRSVHTLERPGVLGAALGWAAQLVGSRADDGDLVDAVQLHAGGLKLSREGVAATVCWGDVEEVYGDTADVWLGALGPEPEPVRGTLRLKRHDGAVHRLPPTLSEATALFATIIARCSRAQTQECRAALSEGSTLTFGPVTLSASELCVREKRLPLEDLAMVSTRPDHLVFARKGGDRPWASVRYEVLPHVTLLLALLPPRASAQSPR